MKLTKADKEILLKMSVPANDFQQIESASRKTKYSLSKCGIGYGEKKISEKEAMEILGRELFLSGLRRSAFHWSAVRIDNAGINKVFFDSSAFFRT